MRIAKVNNEFVDIETNIENMNGLISASLVMPIVKARNANLLYVPFQAPAPVRSSTAFDYFYQSFVKKNPKGLFIEMSWGNAKNNMNEVKTKTKEGETIPVTAIKMDSILSILAIMEYGESFPMRGIVIAFSDEDEQEKRKWLKQFMNKENYDVIKVDYGKFNSIMNPAEFENWIFSVVASSMYDTVWLPFPETEINEYIPGYSGKMMNEGSEWISRFYSRPKTLETAFGGKLSRTDIVRLRFDDDVDEDKLFKAIRCKCGECFECLMNMAMILNLGLDHTKIFKDGFKNDEMLKKIRVMVEENKITPRMIDELSVLL